MICEYVAKIPLSLSLSLSCVFSHFLTYQNTLVSNSSGKHYFFQVAYVDDVQIMTFNSTVMKSDLKQSVLELEMDGNLETNTQRSKESMEMMIHLLRFLSTQQSKNLESHTLQWVYGCGYDDKFMRFGYDGVEIFRLGSEGKSWVSTCNESLWMKHILDECYPAKYTTTYFESTCLQWLRRHSSEVLILLMTKPHTKLIKEAISTNESRLRCWASSFYPAGINITWSKDEVDKINETQSVDTRPDGPGTFQKWSAIVVPSGEEHKYVCSIYHDGFSYPVNLTLELLMSAQFRDVNTHTGLIFGLLLLGGSVIFGVVWKIWRDRVNIPRIRLWR
ncbi:membrane protein S7 [Saimiriine betaherpesvirus 4]|uniref:Membrane protein S7 n=1 Tax=Saimiriine betaherpesvirus 4 TaxID=1535247 RepID=G8XSS7_9BETA|nr:membrane protein S7 [Saimiriine betaherpesvirus 4]AEV80874.1 membrane protein S7 [Saimiriine betaherpesvirus 4]